MEMLLTYLVPVAIGTLSIQLSRRLTRQVRKGTITLIASELSKASFATSLLALFGLLLDLLIHNHGLAFWWDSLCPYTIAMTMASWGISIAAIVTTLVGTLALGLAPRR